MPQWSVHYKKNNKSVLQKISLGCNSIWGGGLRDITRGELHCGLAIYIKKYLKAKEE
jgi:hypothetical protein